MAKLLVENVYGIKSASKFESSIYFQFKRPVTSTFISIVNYMTNTNIEATLSVTHNHTRHNIICLWNYLLYSSLRIPKRRCLWRTGTKLHGRYLSIYLIKKILNKFIKHTHQQRKHTKLNPKTATHNSTYNQQLPPAKISLIKQQQH